MKSVVLQAALQVEDDVNADELAAQVQADIVDGDNPVEAATVSVLFQQHPGGTETEQPQAET